MKEEDVFVLSFDFFPNEHNWRIRNRQIATDTLIAIINAQRQNLPKGFKNVSQGISVKNQNYKTHQY